MYGSSLPSTIILHRPLNKATSFNLFSNGNKIGVELLCSCLLGPHGTYEPHVLIFRKSSDTESDGTTNHLPITSVGQGNYQTNIKKLHLKMVKKWLFVMENFKF